MVNTYRTGLLLALFLLGNNWVNAQKAYFQQQVNFEIEATLNDEAHTLSAFETVTYINTSKSVLDSIYFHLWPNAYSGRHTALTKQQAENGNMSLFYATEEQMGYIDSLDFKTNGKKLTWYKTKEHCDIAVVKLNKPLAPGDSVKISTPFKVKFPGDFSRLGHVGQSYQVTQWYPKPAVFDRDGWHQMPYLDLGEFYNDYGNYKVTLTLPKNYVVGATGDLQNEEEREWLLDRADKTSGKLKFERSNSFPKSSVETKTLTYTQQKVHDFAWFADKRYHVLHGQVKLPHSGRLVDTWLMFINREAELWKDAIPYINKAVTAYSKWNGDYAYNQVTAVYGALSAGGGMEYPNVTVIGNSGSAGSLELVIVHEVGHNWFQGMLGFNERDEPSLDEGINTFNELRYIEEYKPEYSMLGESLGKGMAKWLNFHNHTHRTEFQDFYLFQARANKDQPLSLTSPEYTETNYGAIVYGKMGISVQMLRSALGDSLFDKCMQSFFDKWKFKHPSLQDWKQVMEETSGKDLGWFYNQYYQSTARLDLKLSKVKKKDNTLTLTVKNKGKVSAPFTLTSFSKAGERLDSIKVETLPIEKEVVKLPFKNAHKVVLDANYNLVEYNRRNNTLKTSGMLKKMEPLQFRFITSNENPNKTQIYGMPLAGWNSADELMLGWAFHNKSFIAKKFEWYLGPMYSFHKEHLTGIADVSYHIFPSGFRKITANFNAMRFSYDIPFSGYMTYNRYYPKLKFELKPKAERQNLKQEITAGVLYIEEIYNGTGTPFINAYNTYGELGYYLEKRIINQHISARANFTLHEDFTQGRYELKHRLFYNKQRKTFTTRLFVGHFFNNNSNSPIFNLRMDGQTGFYDYQKNQIFPDRAGNIDVWKNQMNENHGAFKSPTSVGQSSKWMGAVNMKLEAPIKLPLGLYSDIGVAEATDFMYNGGIYVSIIRDICEVYFPVAWSENIKTAYEANGTEYGEKIRFTLNLPLANPYSLIQSIQF